jgi:hypothetical protein
VSNLFSLFSLYLLFPLLSFIIADDEKDQSRPPTLTDKRMFAQNLYNISSEDLGKVIQILDQRCESCIKRIDAEDIEVEIDAIDAASFWVADNFVKEALPGGLKQGSSAKKTPGGK